MADTTQKPRRRWLRYSLRTLLIATTIFAIWLGYLAESAYKQRRAVEVITRLGGTADYEIRLFERPWANHKPKLNVPAWLRDWLGDDWFASIVCVDISRSAESAAAGEPFPLDDLAVLEELPGLKKLFLFGVPTNDDSMIYVSRCRQLDMLSIDGGRISDRGMEMVGGLTHLKGLMLNSPQNCIAGQPDLRISDRGLTFLARLSQLEHLTITGQPITDEGLKQLAALKSLKFLYISGQGITGKGFSKLIELPLESVHLNDTSFDDDGAVALAQIKNLKAIVLDGAPVTDKGVTQFAAMPSLSFLFLKHCPIEGSSLGRLQVDHLSVDYTKVNDNALANIAAMPNLTSLSLAGTPVTDEGLVTLAPLAGRLLALNLAETGITDAGLANLSQFNLLNGIDLRATNVTDAGLVNLAALRLKSIQVGGTKITQQGGRNFEKLTGTRVEFDTD